MKIILGSESKWRKILLEEAGIDFEVMPANIDERAIHIDNPRELTMTLAKSKTEALKSKISEPAILITSDQVVVCNGEILEKPENEEQAKSFLRGYNHSPAEVVTAVVVTNLATGKTAEIVETAIVFFYYFSEMIINELVKDADVYALCGAFKVSEGFEKQIQRIYGEKDCVIGLPIKATLELIKQVL